MGSFMESSYHVYVTCGFNEDSSSHLVSLMVDENEGWQAPVKDFGATWLSPTFELVQR